MTEHERLLGDGLLMGGFQFMYVCFKAVRNLMSRWAVSCFGLLGVLWGNGRSSPICFKRCRHIPAPSGWKWSRSPSPAVGEGSGQAPRGWAENYPKFPQTQGLPTTVMLKYFPFLLHGFPPSPSFGSPVGLPSTAPLVLSTRSPSLPDMGSFWSKMAGHMESST